jgi:hypothetical protein
LFDPSLLNPRIALGLMPRQEPRGNELLFDHVRFRLDRNGEPLMLTPIDIPFAGSDDVR